MGYCGQKCDKWGFRLWRGWISPTRPRWSYPRSLPMVGPKLVLDLGEATVYLGDLTRIIPRTGATLLVVAVQEFIKLPHHKISLSIQSFLQVSHRFSIDVVMVDLQGTDRCFESIGPDCILLVILRLPARLLTSHNPAEPSRLLGRFILSYLAAVLQGLSLHWQKCLSYHWPCPTLGSVLEKMTLIEVAA